jgi:RNA polymerase sigma-70 factor (ECF subfamily)
MGKTNSGPSKASDANPVAGGVTPLSLLERARAHDPEAWHRLVGLYQPLVQSWCSRAGVNATDAEDIAQEVFTTAARALDRFRRDRVGDTFRGWLRSITRTQILLLFRRGRGRPHAEGGSDAWQKLQEVADPLPGPGEEEDSVETDQLYQRAMELVRGEFEQRTWRAFELTVIEDRTTGEVAQELNMTVNNVRQAKSRVLRRLREEVGDLLG